MLQRQSRVPVREPVQHPQPDQVNKPVDSSAVSNFDHVDILARQGGGLSMPIYKV
jgi:hypothetical protein